jgi:heme o synthase
MNLILSFSDRLKAFFQLLKFRLSMTVVFSSCFGYCLSPIVLRIQDILWFGFASLCVTSGANIINQIIEKESDKLMTRTQNRPLPSGRVSVNEAIWFSLICSVIGISILVIEFNVSAALLAFLSLILYGFVYTPLKKHGPLAVLVGALPGAFPPMIGWVAATGQFGYEPGILFAIQFFWQFPHFWAIAWVLDEDYQKAGIKLLPSKGGRDLNSAIQIFIYTLFLLPLCWIPYYLHMTGVNSAVIALICGILFLIQTLYLMKERTNKAAMQLMFGSFVYLPIVQIAYLIDKI